VNSEGGKKLDIIPKRVNPTGKTGTAKTGVSKGAAAKGKSLSRAKRAKKKKKDLRQGSHHLTQKRIRGGSKKGIAKPRENIYNVPSPKGSCQGQRVSTVGVMDETKHMTFEKTQTDVGERGAIVRPNTEAQQGKGEGARDEMRQSTRKKNTVRGGEKGRRVQVRK